MVPDELQLNTDDYQAFKVFTMSQVPVHEVVDMAVVKAAQQLPGQAPEICSCAYANGHNMIYDPKKMALIPS